MPNGNLPVPIGTTPVPNLPLIPGAGSAQQLQGLLGSGTNQPRALLGPVTQRLLLGSPQEELANAVNNIKSGVNTGEVKASNSLVKYMKNPDPSKLSSSQLKNVTKAAQEAVTNPKNKKFFGKFKGLSNKALGIAFAAELVGTWFLSRMAEGKHEKEMSELVQQFMPALNNIQLQTQSLRGELTRTGVQASNVQNALLAQLSGGFQAQSQPTPTVDPQQMMLQALRADAAAGTQLAQGQVRV